MTTGMGVGRLTVGLEVGLEEGGCEDILEAEMGGHRACFLGGNV